MAINLDATGSDWIKETWIGAPYKAKEFYDALDDDMSIQAFRETLRYKAAVRDGLIINDEWVGLI